MKNKFKCFSHHFENSEHDLFRDHLTDHRLFSFFHKKDKTGRAIFNNLNIKKVLEKLSMCLICNWQVY